MRQGTPLGEFVEGRIYCGVNTGLNEAFVIDQTKRDELIEGDPRSAELIRPWLRGKDIGRWKTAWPELHVIFTGRGADIDEYHAIKNHLSWWRNELESKAFVGQRDGGRKPGDHKWFEIQDVVAYHEEFGLPKIMWPGLSRTVRFSYDEDGHYLADTCYFTPVADKWLLALLNSSLFTFLLCQVTNSPPGESMKLHTDIMKRLPIVVPDTESQVQLEKAVNELIRGGASSDDASSIAWRIDPIVFHVYGMTSSERKHVLDWLGERREALGAEMPPEWRKLNSLLAAAGAWKGKVDCEQLKKDIRASRDIHTRPVPRL